MRYNIRSKNKTWSDHRDLEVGSMMTIVTQLPFYLAATVGQAYEGRHDVSHQYPESQSRRKLDLKRRQWAIDIDNIEARIQR